MKLPEFLVVGAIKAGTTAIYQYLIQHPQIFLSPDVKESRFLTGLTPQRDPQICAAVPVITDSADYRALFAQAAPDQILGEVDPWCLYLHDRSIERIKHYLGDQVKIVICLRNPVDRCYSHYYQIVKQSWDVDAFPQTIQRASGNRAEHWYEDMLLEAGCYFRQVEAYLQAFSRAQVLVLLHEEFQAKPLATMEQIFRFIEVDLDFTPDVSYRMNVGGLPRSKIVHTLLSQKNSFTSLLKPLLPMNFRRKVKNTLKNRNMQRYPPLTLEMRRLLTDYYRSDIFRLQDLLKNDFSDWLRVEG